MSYRLVYGEFWTDPKVMEEMTPEDRYFYLFLLTNPSTTNCGIYLITKKQMAFELGYSAEVVGTLMDRFEKQYGLIAYNSETRELALKNWGKYNLTRGGKPVMDCLASELSRVKDKSLIKYIQQNINNQAIWELYEEFSDSSSSRQREDERQGDNTYTDTITYTNTNTNTDTDTEKDADKDSASHNCALSLLQEYEKITGQIGVLNLAALKLAVIYHGCENVKKALNRALERGKFNMSYVNGILKAWAKEGYPEEGDYDGTGGTFKNNGAFKPKEPRMLSEDESRLAEGELL